VVRDAPPAPPAASDISTEDWFRARLAQAIQDLDAQTTGDERTPPFLTLLGQLAGDPESRLRRPPAATQRAMSACRREDVSVGTLVELLQADPSLTQAILARANGAYYSRGGPPCLALSDAIVRQGRQSVHSVLLEQAINSLVFVGNDAMRHMVDRVWSHMVRTAPLARDLAWLFDVDPEQAFALGLLHDVGKLAIFDRIATLRTAQRADFVLAGPTLARTLRLLHAPLGGLCALGWQFGDDAARAIAEHHRDPRPDPPNRFTEVIWLAERVDILSISGQPIDTAELWLAGGLSGDPSRAQAILDGLVRTRER
jgi:HD-like signal output (HDOD) protein